MKKYIVKKDIKFIDNFGLKQGDEVEQDHRFEDNYLVNDYLYFNLPKEVVENNPEYFEEICKECERPLDTFSGSTKIK